MDLLATCGPGTLRRVATAELRSSLERFVTFVNTQVRGDEKSDAQGFLERFFRALGHEGVA